MSKIKVEKCLFVAEEKPVDLYDHVGKIYFNDGEPYIFAQISRDSFALIDLEDGNRWNDEYTDDDYKEIVRGRHNDGWVKPWEYSITLTNR